MYLSIDIDTLDPAFAPGTGTPETGGWSTRELRTIIRGLEELNLIGADVVEVAPAYDTSKFSRAVKFRWRVLTGYGRCGADDDGGGRCSVRGAQHHGQEGAVKQAWEAGDWGAVSGGWLDNQQMLSARVRRCEVKVRGLACDEEMSRKVDDDVSTMLFPFTCFVSSSTTAVSPGSGDLRTT